MSKQNPLGGAKGSIAILIAQNSRALYYPALFSIAIFKLFLIRNFRTIMFSDAIYDDLLYIEQASSILAGNWLGNYGYLTLARGPIFPLFLALNSLLGLRLSLTHNLLYLIAIFCLIELLRRLRINRLFLVLLFAFLALNPITFIYSHYRIMRDFFFASIFIGCFCSLIYWLMEDFTRRWRVCFGGVVTGVLFFLFWYTREESVLILPSLGLVGIFIFFRRIYQKKSAPKIGLLLAVFSAFAVFFALKTLISNINHHFYGTYEIMEVREGSFKEAYAKLVQLKYRYKRFDPPIDFAARQRLYALSPTFQKIRRFLDPSPEGISYNGANFIWMLRKAISRAGYYRNPQLAQDFYGKLKGEIEAAYERGALHPNGAFYFSGVPIESELFTKVFKRAPHAIEFLLTFFGSTLTVESRRFDPNRNDKKFPLFQEITHDILVFDNCPEVENVPKFIHHFHIKGSIAAGGNVSGLGLNSPSKKPVALSLVQYNSIGKNPHGVDLYFDLKGSCAVDCELFAFNNKNIIYSAAIFPRLEIQRGVNRSFGDVTLFVGSVKTGRKTKAHTTMGPRIGDRERYFIEELKGFYKKVVPWLAVIGLSAFALVIVNGCFIRSFSILSVVVALMYLTVFVRFFGLLYIDVYIFDTIMDRYFSPVYPLFFSACLLSLYQLGSVTYNQKVRREG